MLPITMWTTPLFHLFHIFSCFSSHSQWRHDPRHDPPFCWSWEQVFPSANASLGCSEAGGTHKHRRSGNIKGGLMGQWCALALESLWTRNSKNYQTTSNNHKQTISRNHFRVSKQLSGEWSHPQLAPCKQYIIPTWACGICTQVQCDQVVTSKCHCWESSTYYIMKDAAQLGSETASEI
jgi:hypothetical protein